MTRVVLDASAVISLLKEDRGASKVAAVVADAVIGSVSHAEVVGHYMRLGAPADEIRTMLEALPIEVVVVDEALSWEVGALGAAAVNLSLGDRFCLALARRLEQPAYTADLALKEAAAATGVKVVLVR